MKGTNQILINNLIRLLTPVSAQSVAVSIATAEEHTIVSPSATTDSLRIVKVALYPAAAVGMTFKFGTTVLATITADKFFEFDLPFPWMGEPNEAFTITLDGAISVTGFVQSYEV